MVVPVLITNCQVSEKLNIGPVTAQTMITRNARIKARGFPVARVTRFENLLKNSDKDDFFFAMVIKFHIKKIRPFFKTA